jgi:hypothetical protein
MPLLEANFGPEGKAQPVTTKMSLEMLGDIDGIRPLDSKQLYQARHTTVMHRSLPSFISTNDGT